MSLNPLTKVHLSILSVFPFFYCQTRESPWAPINPKQREKNLQSSAVFPLMNVHYKKYRLTVTVASDWPVFCDPVNRNTCQ